jgi:hypothetical protein
VLDMPIEMRQWFVKRLEKQIEYEKQKAKER